MIIATLTYFPIILYIICLHVKRTLPVALLSIMLLISCKYCMYPSLMQKYAATIGDPLDILEYIRCQKMIATLVTFYWATFICSGWKQEDQGLLSPNWNWPFHCQY